MNAYFAVGHVERFVAVLRATFRHGSAAASCNSFIVVGFQYVRYGERSEILVLGHPCGCRGHGERRRSFAATRALLPARYDVITGKGRVWWGGKFFFFFKRIAKYGRRRGTARTFETRCAGDAYLACQVSNNARMHRFRQNVFVAESTSTTRVCVWAATECANAVPAWYTYTQSRLCGLDDGDERTGKRDSAGRAAVGTATKGPHSSSADQWRER